MTEIQNRLFEMLDEIDQICENNGLSYFLSGRLALNAYQKNAIADGNWVFEVLMPYNDILCFQDIIGSLKYKNREMESVYTNEDYAEFIFRYVDSSTLYFEMQNAASARKSHGLYIRIRPLYMKNDTRLGKSAAQYEWFWRLYNKDYPKPYKEASSKMTTKVKRKVVLAWIENHKLRYHERMLSLRKESQKDFDISSGLYMEKLNYSKNIYFPDKLFSNKKKYLIEGHEYYMPADIEEYLEAVLGNNWKNKKFNNKPALWTVISSAKIPYKEFMENVSEKDLRQLFDEKKDARNNLDNYENKISYAWNVVQRSGIRISLANEYAPLKNKILTASEENDWNQLRNLLASYDEQELDFERKGLVICFDREIFEAYLKLLRHDGKNERADKMLTQVPRQHLQ